VTDLVISETGAEDDGGVSHVDQVLQDIIFIKLLEKPRVQQNKNVRLDVLTVFVYRRVKECSKCQVMGVIGPSPSESC